MQYALADIESLAPYERNSRIHPAKQVRGIKKSIETFGWVGAVLVNGNTIASGHATVEAVKAIYEKGGLLYPAPGQKAGGQALPKGKIPIQDCTGWTDKQMKAFVIAMNRLQELSKWDRGILAEELPELDEPDLTALMEDLEITDLVEIHNQGGRFDFSGGYDYTAADTGEDKNEGESQETAENEGDPADTDAAKVPVVFTLEPDEYQAWLAHKKKHKAATFKQVFLKGLTA
jgi:hypothetical protein